jgi:hypothetical protein
LLKVNPIHVKTRVKSNSIQSRDAKTAIETKVVNENQTAIETKVVNETRYEYRVSKRIGVSKRIVNRMGSEDLCSRETDRTVPKRTGA